MVFGNRIMITPFHVFITIIAAFLPAFVWLTFFLKEDIHPEPKRLILYTFGAGALSTIPVIISQIIFQNISATFAYSVFISIIGLALIEEIFKFFAAYLAIHHSPQFDEPVDAMVYLVAASLGFATIENLFVMSNMFDQMTDFSAAFFVETLLLRFIGATLLHAIASGVFGYAWIRGIITRKLFSRLVIGLFAATVIHAIFNYLILQFEGSNFFYPSFFLVVAVLFVLNDFEKLRSDHHHLSIDSDGNTVSS